MAFDDTVFTEDYITATYTPIDFSDIVFEGTVFETTLVEQAFQTDAFQTNAFQAEKKPEVEPPCGHGTGRGCVPELFLEDGVVVIDSSGHGVGAGYEPTVYNSESTILVDVTGTGSGVGLAPFVRTTKLSGGGTSGNPYLITCLGDLELIGTSPYTVDKYYKVNNDFDCSETALSYYNSGAGFIPIPGTFTGRFDGNNKTISGLFINRPTTDYVGLFRYGSNVLDLTMSNCNITGKNYVGVITGWSEGNTITNCDIINSTVLGKANYVGGISGYSYNQNITLSTVTGSTITGETGLAGGITGGHQDREGANLTITNCTVSTTTVISPATGGGIVAENRRSKMDGNSFSGTIRGNTDIGGIVGRFGYIDSNYYVKNSTVTGTIENGTGTPSRIGGIVGRVIYGGLIDNCSVSNLTFNVPNSDNVGNLLGYGDSGSYNTTITNCNISNNISGRDRIGGLVGRCDRIIIDNTNSFTGNVSGRDGIGGIVGAMGFVNDSFKVDGATVSGTVTGTGNSIGGFVGYVYYGGLFNNLNNSNVTISSSPTSSYVGGIIGNHDSNSYNCNITNCTGVKNISGVNYVGGIVGYHMRGNLSGCTVSNITVTGTGTDVGGLAGNKGPTGAISTPTVSAVTVNGVNSSGLLCGYNGSTSAIDLSGRTITGTVNATGKYVGGLVGAGRINVINATIDNNITINASATTDYVGGVLGGSGGSINITYSTVTMPISGRSYVGGLVGGSYGGANEAFIVNNCTVNTTITGTGNYIGGICGHNEIYGSGTKVSFCTIIGTINGSGNSIGGVCGQGRINTIEDITIDNRLTINASATSDNVGGISGFLYSTWLIQRCTVTTPITGRDFVGGLYGRTDSRNEPVVIINNTVNTTITGRNNVGGICGHSDQYGSGTKVSFCTIKGTVSGSGISIGGIGGSCRFNAIEDMTIDSDLTISASATSDNVGGLLGNMWATWLIQRCTVTTPITGRDFVGGLYGRTDSRNEPVVIINNTVNTTITGRNNVGGICGHSDQYGSGTKVSFCTIKGTVSGSGISIGGIGGSCRFNATEDITIDSDLIISASATSDRVGGLYGNFWCCLSIQRCTVTTPITGRDFVGGLLGGSGDDNCNFVLTNCAVNTTITGRNYVGGILGYHNQYGSSTKISNSTIKGTINASGIYVGGVAGMARKDIENIHITPELTINTASTSDEVGGLCGRFHNTGVISNCSVAIPISGRDYVGGIYGRANDVNATLTMDRCFYKGSVSGRVYTGGLIGRTELYAAGSEIKQSFAAGTVTATGDYTGGLVGEARAKITNCFAKNNVTGTGHVGGLVGRQNTHAIATSYSKGAVSGTGNVGGLVGSKNTGTATNSFWDTQTSGQGSSALGTGKTTAEMLTQGTYTSFDFSTPIWVMPADCKNYGYPWLQNCDLGQWICTQPSGGTADFLVPEINIITLIFPVLIDDTLTVSDEVTLNVAMSVQDAMGSVDSVGIQNSLTIYDDFYHSDYKVATRFLTEDDTLEVDEAPIIFNTFAVDDTASMAEFIEKGIIIQDDASIDEEISVGVSLRVDDAISIDEELHLHVSVYIEDAINGEDILFIINMKDVSDEIGETDTTATTIQVVEEDSVVATDSMGDLQVGLSVDDVISIEDTYIILDIYRYTASILREKSFKTSLSKEVNSRVNIIRDKNFKTSITRRILGGE